MRGRTVWRSLERIWCVGVTCVDCSSSMALCSGCHCILPSMKERRTSLDRGTPCASCFIPPKPSFYGMGGRGERPRQGDPPSPRVLVFSYRPPSVRLPAGSRAADIPRTGAPAPSPYGLAGTPSRPGTLTMGTLAWACVPALPPGRWPGI